MREIPLEISLSQELAKARSTRDQSAYGRRRAKQAFVEKKFLKKSSSSPTVGCKEIKHKEGKRTWPRGTLKD